MDYLIQGGAPKAGVHKLAWPVYRASLFLPKSSLSMIYIMEMPHHVCHLSKRPHCESGEALALP